MPVENHYFDRAGNGTAAAFYAVGIEESFVVAAAVIGGELHGAYAGTAFAFHLAAAAYEDAAIVVGEIAAAGRDPRRQSPHRAEGAPCARSKDKSQCHADDSGDEYYIPENTAHGIPVAPREIHLYAEDGKNKADHEYTESPGANKGRNRFVR